MGARAEVMPSHKTKKAQESINSKLALVMKSGKFSLGYSTTMKTMSKGKSRLVIIANNCPALRKSEMEYYAMLSKTDVIHYKGSNIDLGLLAVNSSVYLALLSPMVEIPIF